jgi:SAM-dependent methyltransferase
MRYHDFFVERVREGERVLDVGCGKGELAYDLAERAGASVVAVDLEERPLAFARERFAHLRIDYRLADATSFGPEERFDVAVLSNVLEHVDDRVQLLRRLSRVAPRFLFRVPMWNREWTVPLRRELGLAHLGPGHFVEYDEPAFRAELAEAGLRVTHSQVNWGELWAEATVDELHSPSETQPR